MNHSCTFHVAAQFSGRSGPVGQIAGSHVASRYLLDGVRSTGFHLDPTGTENVQKKKTLQVFLRPLPCKVAVRLVKNVLEN